MFTKMATQRQGQGQAKANNNNNKSNFVQCKKHPKHKQAPGVCALCLREKLSQFQSSSSSSSRRICSVALMEFSSSTSSVSSYYSSSSASSYVSPLHHRYRFSTREGSYSYKGSLSFLFSGKSSTVLTKSRSLAFVSKMRSKEQNFDDVKKKKTKGGFLSKLMHPRRKKNIDESGLVYSRTTVV